MPAGHDRPTSACVLFTLTGLPSFAPEGGALGCPCFFRLLLIRVIARFETPQTPEMCPRDMPRFKALMMIWDFSSDRFFGILMAADNLWLRTMEGSAKAVFLTGLDGLMSRREEAKTFVSRCVHIRSSACSRLCQMYHVFAPTYAS